MLYTCKAIHCKFNFLGPVHFWLDDIHRPGSAVSQATIAHQVMLGDQHCDHCIKKSLWRLLSVRKQDCTVRHQMADVSNQHQTAAGQCQFRAIRSGHFFVNGQAALNRFSALGELLGKTALHQT